MKISTVIPTYRSQDNLPILLDKVCKIYNDLSFDYEIIVVDDNSPDNSLSYLRTAAQQNHHVKVLSLARNFGQQVAISAGLQYVTGDAVVIMDDDLQDPPEFIPVLINKWSEGYDVVYAIKTHRKEGVLKRLAYKLFYQILSKLSDIDIPRDSGDFCIMSKQIVTILNRMDERDRFVRGLRAWVGFKQTGLECPRGKRNSGEPAYTLSKMVKLSMDGIFSLSYKPLRVTSFFGFTISFLAFIGIILTLVQKVLSLIYPESKFAIWPGLSSILLSVLFIGGIQLLCIGIIGEYVGRIFNEVKQRPMFLIKEAIGIEFNQKTRP